jgi:hypothetical protein
MYFGAMTPASLRKRTIAPNCVVIPVILTIHISKRFSPGKIPHLLLRKGDVWNTTKSKGVKGRKWQVGVGGWEGRPFLFAEFV